MDARSTALRTILKEERLDALILTKRENQRYLEGFTGGDCFLVVSDSLSGLVADGRYTEMGERECRTAKIFPHRAPHPPFGEVIAAIARDNGFSRVGFEKDHMTWGQHEAIGAEMKKFGAELVPTSGLVERIRSRKTPEEAALLASACRIADRALKDVLPCIKPGVSELDVQTELEYKLRTGGADGFAFETMVLFGVRSSQPHATPRGNVRLREGEFVLIDYGAAKEGYRSDTTRTFVCGKASDEQKAAYRTVLTSQLAALAMVAPGANGREINRAALDIIEGAGIPSFTYGIGHGVGLEIHEEPFLRQNRDVILEPDMTVTIEPGTYRPGWGGIRIEDTVLVTGDGHRVLTEFGKELMEL